MIIIFAIILSVAVVLIAIAIYSFIKQKAIIDFSRDLTDIINEAEQIKQDLHLVMENAVQISRTLVDELNLKVEKTGSKVSPSMDFETETDFNSNSEKNLINKVRVYELAKELGMDTRQLLNILAKMGYSYKSHMNKLDYDTIVKIKNYIAHEGLIKEKVKELKEVDEIITEEKNDFDNDLTIEQINQAHPYIGVKALYEKGYSIKQIAKLLNRSQGEVSLLLSLAKKSKAI